MPAISQFADLPSHFELPATENSQPVVVGTLYENPQYLLTTRLHFPEESLKRGLEFSMRRTGEDQRTWLVSMSKPDGEQPIDIAKFWKTEFEFNFQWLESALNDEEANYLRNGALEFETDRVAWLNLRAPTIIEGFRLSDDDSSDKTSVDIPWLPERKSIVVQVQPFHDREIPSHATPDIASKDPARMFFTSDEKKAFIWLEVTTESRLKKLHAKLSARINGKVKPLKANQIATFQKQFSSLAASLQAQHDALNEGRTKKTTCDNP